MALDDVQKAILHSGMMTAYLETVRDVATEAAKQACPVLTGTLRDSIESEITPDGEVIISAGTTYAASVDRGDGGREPVPFLSGAAIDAAKKVRKPR